ncbi:MAG TPA: multiheme c-type cytochrome [Kofleriaceae bacterium]|nr:multiheme c-type cytochrome [Kofleriaceae bacterium]
MFALAELRGQIGPCGCTADPLGDLSRTAQMIADARAAGPTLVVDAGSLLYSQDPIPSLHETQEELKADLLARTYREDLATAALGLGWADLPKGPAKVRLPRQAANVAADAGIPLEKPTVTAVGGAKVGVFGVIASDAVKGVSLSDPAAAGKAAVAELRRGGAQVVIALVQATSKKDAAAIVRAIGGIDFAVAGLGLATPEPRDVEPEATRVGDGWLVVPADRGQVVSRIDVTLRGGAAGPLSDAVGTAAAAQKRAGIEKQLAALEADLARFAADKAADPAFVRQKQGERDRLVTQRDQLAKQPYVIPEKGSYFTLDQVRINKTKACSPKVQDAVTAFYRAAGEANAKAAASIKPVPVPAGQATFVGNAKCEDCHDDAIAFWKQTRHAGAWETLVQRGQQLDLDCIGCHVTGWGKPGGATLAINEPLRDVGCETCHGPGSIHVEKGGNEKPSAVVRNPPQEMCARECHTKEHSDTFQYEAYLRDIVGKGHGDLIRGRLGTGATGGQLRKAALEKAGRMGPGCIR